MAEPALPQKKSTPRKTWGRIMLVGAVATVAGIVNMSTDTEAPSQALALLQYLALGLGIFALVGGVIGFLSAK
jgi:hypothetical protein